MYPMKLTPALMDFIWGGTRLKTDFHKQTELEKVAESWELSCHPKGPSVISNGDCRGMTLAEYIEKNGKSVLGTNCERFEDFPILIKLIDAKDNLSVQVHPDNAYAMAHEGEYGKTEMWYVIDADPGATLLYGFKDKISPEEFRRRIEENTLLEVTNAVEVKPGDVLFIESGTLHAIGKGIMIAEIQQNSSITYRIYDYGRVGNDGKPRELHIEKAIDVTKLEPPTRGIKPEGMPEQKDGYTATRLASCAYFTTTALELADHAALTVDGASFHSLLCVEGGAELSSANGAVTIEKGDSVFLPAGFGDYRLEGDGKLVLTTV